MLPTDYIHPGLCMDALQPFTTIPGYITASRELRRSYEAFKPLLRGFAGRWEQLARLGGHLQRDPDCLKHYYNFI